MPTIFIIARWFLFWRAASTVLAVISRNCFWIYLLHMFVIQFAAQIAGFLKISGSFGFVVYMLLTIPAAVALPVAARYCCCRLRRLKQT